MISFRLRFISHINYFAALDKFFGVGKKYRIGIKYHSGISSFLFFMKAAPPSYGFLIRP